MNLVKRGLKYTHDYILKHYRLKLCVAEPVSPNVKQHPFLKQYVFNVTREMAFRMRTNRLVLQTGNVNVSPSLCLSCNLLAYIQR